MSKTKKLTYRLRLHDYFTEEDRSKTIDLDVKYETVEQAAEAGWAILEAFALVHGFGCENQGDQFLAYYDEGEKDGWGALAIEVLDSEGNIYKEL